MKLGNIADKYFLLDVLSTLERIIGNVLYNGEDTKYWQVKTVKIFFIIKESSTFKRFISSTEYAIEILNLAGFHSKIINGQKYYIFNQLVTSEALKIIMDELGLSKKFIKQKQIKNNMT